MNRRLGDLIKALVFSLPLAAPGVALAQSAQGTGTSGSQQQQQGGDTAGQMDTGQPGASDTASDQMKNDQMKSDEMKKDTSHRKGRKGAQPSKKGTTDQTAPSPSDTSGSQPPQQTR